VAERSHDQSACSESVPGEREGTFE